jgi:PEP-CTERM motif
MINITDSETSPGRYQNAPLARIWPRGGTVALSILGFGLGGPLVSPAMAGCLGHPEDNFCYIADVSFAHEVDGGGTFSVVNSGATPQTAATPTTPEGWASASSESANNGTLEVRTVTNNDDSYAAQAEASLSYTFRLDSTPGAPGASVIPLHVIASAESLRDTNFADEKATIEIDQGGLRLAYAEQKILSGREIDLLSLNQTIDVAPDTDIVVTMFASSNIISFAGNGRRSSGVLLDPLFDIAPEYASLYTLVGLPEGTASAAVPEPTTWAMMVIGFAGLGFAGYRTSRRTDAAAG